MSKIKSKSKRAARNLQKKRQNNNHSTQNPLKKVSTFVNFNSPEPARGEQKPTAKTALRANPQSAIRNPQSKIPPCPPKPMAKEGIQNPQSENWLSNLIELDRNPDGYRQLLNTERLPEWFSQMPQQTLERLIDHIDTKLQGNERGLLIDKIAHLLNTTGTKNARYEANHRLIQEVTKEYVETHGKMPSVVYLSENTGLSRQTIYKHREQFISPDRYQETQAELDFQSKGLMDELNVMGLTGSIPAVRAFIMLNLSMKRVEIQNQKNDIELQKVALEREKVELQKQNFELKKQQHNESTSKPNGYLEPITRIYTQQPRQEKELYWQDPAVHGPMPEPDNPCHDNEQSPAAKPTANSQ